MDDFGEVLDHLASLHPSRYGALLDGVSAVCLTGLGEVPDQNVALRLVVLVDRLYDRDIPVLAGGEPLDRVFSEEMLRGGYRKKYRRALSRLVALAREGAHLTEAGHSSRAAASTRRRNHPQGAPTRRGVGVSGALWVHLRRPGTSQRSAGLRAGQG